jgi:tetratricopeptide (TPR) repeat protein
MMCRRLNIALLLLLLSFNTLSMAKEKQQYLLTEKTYKALTAAQELMSGEQYAKAEIQLLALLKKTKPDSYDQAVVQQTLGYVYSSKEQYRKALAEFQQALDSGALPEQVSHGLRYNLGQLLLAEEEYREGVKVLEQWLKAEPSPPNSAHVLIASAYYELNNFSQTVQYMNIAVGNEKQPAENWYQLLLAAHMELKQYVAGIKVLEKLIVRYPQKEPYWQQLASLYAQQDKHVSVLAVQVLAQRLELSDRHVLVRLSELYRYLNIPYKAAQLLDKGMQDGVIVQNQKNLNRLADSWLAAREKEKAVVVLKRVAKRDSTGESDLKYGRVLFDLEQWQGASVAFDNSLQKLTGKSRGMATLMAGLAQFHLGHLKRAQVFLNKATAYQREQQQALYWLNYVEQVIQNKAVEQQREVS